MTELYSWKQAQQISRSRVSASSIRPRRSPTTLLTQSWCPAGSVSHSDPPILPLFFTHIPDESQTFFWQTSDKVRASVSLVQNQTFQTHWKQFSRTRRGFESKQSTNKSAWSEPDFIADFYAWGWPMEGERSKIDIGLATTNEQ